MKTQIRFGENDLVVLTKQKGSDETYKRVNMFDFTGGIKLPEFDMKLKWKIQEDRPPRRRIPQSRESMTEKSGREDPSGQKNLIRQHSENQEDLNHSKKKRRNVTQSNQQISDDPSTRNEDMNITQ